MVSNVIRSTETSAASVMLQENAKLLAGSIRVGCVCCAIMGTSHSCIQKVREQVAGPGRERMPDKPTANIVAEVAVSDTTNARLVQRALTSYSD
jgi:hypothetical protein